VDADEKKMTRRQLLCGQLLCIFGLLLLLAVVPFLPRVSGLPRHRIVEMIVFWAAQWVLVLGMGISLSASASDVEIDPGNRRRVVAALGVLLALFTCFIALSNLAYTSLQGAGWHSGLRPGRLFPRELGYFLSIPLLLAVACQLPILGLLRSRSEAAIVHERTRIGRLVLQILLLALFGLFAASCMIFFVDRWFAIIGVVITWLSSFLFLGLGCQQVAWASGGLAAPRSGYIP